MGRRWPIGAAPRAWDGAQRSFSTIRYSLLLTALLALVALARASDGQNIVFRGLCGCDDAYVREVSNASATVAKINERGKLPFNGPPGYIALGKPSSVKLGHMTMATVRKIDRKILAKVTDEQARQIGAKAADKDAVQAYVSELVAAHRAKSKRFYTNCICAAVMIALAASVGGLFLAGRRVFATDAMAAAPKV